MKFGVIKYSTQKRKGYSLNVFLSFDKCFLSFDYSSSRELVSIEQGTFASAL